jgi:hypothetical protein
MSNNFWSSLTVEINQLFEKQEDQTIQKTEETTESYKLYSACKTGNVEMINKCIENVNDPCEYNTYDYDYRKYAFINACEKGFITVVDRLLQNKWGGSLFNYNVALYRACLYNHIAIVDLLLQDKRIDPYSVLKFTKIYSYENVVVKLQQEIIDRLQQEIQNREKSNQ